jgi:hypothetical protein
VSTAGEKTALRTRLDQPGSHASALSSRSVRLHLGVLCAVVLTLHCAWSGRYPQCGTDSDCSDGQTCVHDRIGNYCLIRCDVDVDAGHDSRCPPGFMCWAEEPNLVGNVCREGVDPSWRNQMLQRYLRRLDGGLCCGGSYFLVVDGGEIIEHRPLFPRDR